MLTNGSLMERVFFFPLTTKTVKTVRVPVAVVTRRRGQSWKGPRAPRRRTPSQEPCAEAPDTPRGVRNKVRIFFKGRCRCGRSAPTSLLTARN